MMQSYNAKMGNVCDNVQLKFFLTRVSLFWTEGQNEQVVLTLKALKLAEIFWDRRTEGHIFSLFLCILSPQSQATAPLKRWAVVVLRVSLF